MKIKTIIIVIVVIAVAAGLIVWGKVSSNKKKASLTSRDVALACTTDMATEFHIHPELSIIIDGEPFVIPAEIGIVNGCMNAIHTHDASGTIHVEAPVQRDFTLGDFFAVWKKPFSNEQLMEYKAIDGATITMTINGKAVDTYEDTVLKDKDKIVITYRSNQ